MDRLLLLIAVAAGLLCAAPARAGDRPLTNADLSTAWADDLHAEMTHDLRGWAVAGIGSGAFQLGTFVALPFRAPLAVDFAFGNTISWLPIAVGALTTWAIREDLARAPTLAGFRQRMLAGWIGLALGATVAYAALAAPVVLVGIFARPGLGVALAAIPVALTVASVVMGGYADRARTSAKRRYERRARVVVAGPGALVVVF